MLGDADHRRDEAFRVSLSVGTGAVSWTGLPRGPAANLGARSEAGKCGAAPWRTDPPTCLPPDGRLEWTVEVTARRRRAETGEVTVRTRRAGGVTKSAGPVC